MRRSNLIEAFGLAAMLTITAAGASAPEVLVEEIIDAFAARFEVSVENVSGPALTGLRATVRLPILTDCLGPERSRVSG